MGVRNRGKKWERKKKKDVFIRDLSVTSPLPDCKLRLSEGILTPGVTCAAIKAHA